MPETTFIKGTHTGKKIKVEIKELENAITLVRRCQQMQSGSLTGVAIVESCNRIDSRYVQALEETLHVPPTNAYATVVEDDSPFGHPVSPADVTETEPFMQFMPLDDEKTSVLNEDPFDQPIDFINVASINDFVIEENEANSANTLDAEDIILNSMQNPSEDEDDMSMSFLDAYDDKSITDEVPLAYNLKAEPFETDFLGRTQEEIENDQFALQQQFHASVHFLDKYAQRRFKHHRTLHITKDDRLLASLLLEKELRRATLAQPFFEDGVAVDELPENGVTSDIRKVDYDWYIKDSITYYPSAEYDDVLNADQDASFTASKTVEPFSYTPYHNAILSVFETVTNIEMMKAPVLQKFHKVIEALHDVNNTIEAIEHRTSHDMRALSLKADVLSIVATELGKAMRTGDITSIERQFESQSVLVQYLLQIDVHVLKNVNLTEPFQWAAYIHTTGGDVFAHKLLLQAMSHVDMYAKSQAFNLFDYHFPTTL